jgi:Ca2+-transporting ATPase
MADSRKLSGLSQKEAEAILKKGGYNELPSQKKRSAFFILIKVLSEPMLLFLAVSGAVYFSLGELKDAIMLISAIFLLIGIVFYQQRKTEKTLDALRNLSSPRALVIRDGEQKRIAGREVVKGDIIVIYEGDRISADAVVLSCENFSVDESLLTGESLPVKKIEWDGKLKNQRPGGEGLPFVYSGSLVVSGRGLAEVVSIGLNTEMGKIGKSLERIKTEDTLLQKETAKIVSWMALIGIVLCVFVAVVYALEKNNLLEGFLAGLTLSMAMLPEEFPVVLLIFLTLGAWRLSKRKVLTRNSAAIETLGASTVLCADKTGTLTLNKIKLISLYCAGSFYEMGDSSSAGLPENFSEVLEYGVLASQKNPFDPIEKELNEMGKLHLSGLRLENMELKKSYPFSKKLFALTHAWKLKDEKEFLIATKGAPETILDLCRIKGADKKDIMQKVGQMSEKGLRVLGVANAKFLGQNLPDSQLDFDFDFNGLLGFADPVRHDAAKAVKEAYNAGIRVIMITGDYPGTAQFVARKIGIKNPDKYLTGEELEKMNHLELRKEIKDINIFSRVVPEQKLVIVNALKANNEIVAMTGDGVNDAPALKSAHIGIAMGERGTDVAREASSLVLLNDDFSSIVAAVKLGRKIYDNLKKAMGYILAVHVPVAGMSVLPIFFGFPQVLLPAHIAFLELIIDPACSTVFEAGKEDKNIMKRPPRNLRQQMFNFKTVSIHFIQGAGVLFATFFLFAFAIKSGRSEAEARSLAFASLVLSNLALIVINLSWSRNVYETIKSADKILFIIAGAALLGLAVVLYVPFFSELFHLAPIYWQDFVFIIFFIVIGLGWFEILKLFRKNL